jgi:uncharacterized protein (DUF362 family)
MAACEAGLATGRPPDCAVTRRDLLKTLAVGGLLVGCGALGSCRGRRADSASSAPNGWAGGLSAPLRRDGVVVIVRSPKAITSRRKVDSAAIERMLAAGLTRLTEARDPAQAWRRLFAPGDVIGLKVNCLGAPTTHTHVEVALAVAQGLAAAGLPAGNVIIYDRLTDELERAGYPVAGDTGVRCLGSDQRGYDAEPTEAGEAGSCFSRIVSEDCTALINLPLLKDHDVAGVSISLKNHFGSINNPNKLHLDHCCPYVADLNLAPAIRGKQRLIICDALEVIYDGGPTYRPATTYSYGGLLIGTDPVALDRVGWRIIEDLRAKAGLKPLSAEGREPKYIAVAGDAGHRLGVADLAAIQRLELSVS